ncbi:tropomodulin-4 [Cricetulus griseus]|uniref:Tropomodulin-4 n=1 Tax=Cricetulus griseus TaxID=10029 RepID=A0A2Z6LC48_CRIGR|nr:tropomodulin-4 [Cricetulus griseus]
MSSYQKELEKYRDIDEDEILRTLSPEELEQLDCELQEMDPENMLLPAGLRQRDQTKKSPTGPLDRDALLQYLEQQALEVKERDDLVPFTGEKKVPASQAVAGMLRENRSLQSLNIESNFISSTGLMAVLKAVRENATLTELRVDNQRQWPGDAVEMEMATVLEQCPSIVRFGYHFTQQGPRARAAQAMTRNNELRK